MSITTRFAPSPTGYLHLGHAASGLFAWCRAHDGGGQFLLRLEDIDPTRCRPEYAAAILEDLAWLGIDWDGDVRVQSEHLQTHAPTLQGPLAGARWTAVSVFLYANRHPARDRGQRGGAARTGRSDLSGTCHALSQEQRAARIEAGERFARGSEMEAALGSRVGRSVARKPGKVAPSAGRNGLVMSCQPERRAVRFIILCVTHDDALQGVTLVTRGEDLQPATDVHRVLQALMGWPEPAYAHHKLLRDPTGRRLAKRDRDLTLRDLRAAGVTPSELRTAPA